MQLIISLILFSKLVCFCNGVSIRTDPERILMDTDIERELSNVDHVRRKRYLGLSKKFKLNKRYQECIGPGDAKGHCKHLSFCPMDVLSGRRNTLEYLCIIEKTFVGVCCPDDIALSGVIGSQLIMDLPAGGEDYDATDDNTGCGLGENGVTKAKRIQEWPWLAALYRMKEMQQGLEQQFCGGALITDTHILTAAHCAQGISASEMRVRLGEYDFSKPNETRSKDYSVAEIIQHEDFVLSTYDNDIAIIRLAQPTSFNTYVWPICLPPSGETFENETVVVAGWGQQYFAGPTSEVLMQVVIPVWEQQNCVDSFLQRITDNTLCAAGYDGGKDSCQGDSGGPLMYQLKNGRWVTVGIVSWGIECGNKGSPGIYTRVNKYLPWIVRNTIAKQ
ncbi:trypsin-1-like isoform X2 [Cylas formicarius]|uniref:trypsin-1-like isoform X2 n=1 Tax=Cylas formicarius TaxID=197179 RepID=UPI00295866EB|nr:trypsin-1-like isoform X2 [Cylas formicarius]